ncbi:hypothetical protein AB0K48_48935 [Nonomuraea sp. NPDC055795]
MQVPRFLPGLRTKFLPKAAAVAALATVLTTAGFATSANAGSSASAASCRDHVATDTMVAVTCDARPYSQWRVAGKWCSSGFNCNTVLGNWASNGSRSTAYHPGGKYFTDSWILVR